MPKINKEEYELLISIVFYWKWLARDRDGRLYKFHGKPKKVDSFRWNDRKQTGLGMSGDRFQFIQWEDEEPYNVTELIEEYEIEQHIKESVELGEQAMRDHARKQLQDESEETEVKKDIEWLEDEVGKIVSEYERENIFANFTRYMIYDIKDAINQLDEPEQPKITLQDVTDKLWELPLNSRKLWLARLNDEFQEGYIVPLGLKTTDGEEQYLTYNGSYFASRRNKYLQQTFDTLEEIPEFYRGLAERVL